MEKLRTILVFRFSSIGDIVQLTSPLQTLKDQFPDARLDIITLDEYAEILIDHPFINRIIKISRSYSYCQLKSIGKKISLQKYDLIIDLHNVLRSKIILKHIKGSKKIIYKKPRWKRFKLIEFKKDDFEDNFTQRWLYHQCLDTVFNHQYEIPKNKLVIKDSEQREIKMLLDRHDVNGSFITIIPGAKWKQKTWISKRYSEVIDYIKNHLRYKVIMLGGDNDDICNSISKINRNVIDLHGKLTLRESIALISCANLTIGSDTGLMHASEAVGVPVVMIIGPTSIQMGGGVMLEKSFTLEKDIWCRPCSQNGKSPCFRSQQYCMNQISSSNVINAVKRILN
jgi:lipopolysaccharide heptosyltransferase II